MKLQTILIATIATIAFLMSGCASKNMQAQNSGFFDDYKQFDKKSDVKPSLEKYEKIMLAPVKVISVTAKEEQTPKQKKLYEEIANYLNVLYKKDIEASGSYEIVDAASPNTLILETGISAVEVHLDDEKWNQLSPVTLDLNVVSYNAYMDEDVRILGEMRLIDADTNEVVYRGLKIQKDAKIIIAGDSLELEDVKSALDSWLAQVRKDISK